MKGWLIHLLMLCTVSHAAAGLVPSDFARGFFLQVPEGGAIYRLEIPAELYRTVINHNLADIAVFNAANELVPHTIHSAIKVDERSERKKVPFFPLHAENEGNTDDLAMRLTRSPEGDILQVRAIPRRERAALSGYLLDISSLTEPLSELEFTWQADGQGGIFALRIDSSDDLVHWQTRIPRGVLAELRFQGQVIQQNTIALPKIDAKYLRIVWPATNPKPEFLTVTGLLNSSVADRDLHWQPALAPNHWGESEPKEIFYSLETRVTPAAIRITFPEENSFASLALYSRGDERQQWQKRCEKPFYQLRVDELLVEDTLCSFAPAADRLWRLVVEEDGAAFGKGRWPTLAFGFQPRQLTFVGRGQHPFLLAFGSGKPVGELQKYATDVAAVAGRDGGLVDGVLVRRAKVGEAVELGGEEALQQPAAPLPWRTWLLWLVLILGVAALGSMARSLLKEMRTKPQE
jgi:hypothetical protein